ncbi:hypothetical protein [Pedobacter ginsengisoli]|uniref:hypothetical protein n=1 Tax=Pedobacter ginsengisoli TaxID=363852 RepID=UPI00254D2279|nr:hypothetical protein [Pedobacter ginsengisoli]
MKVTKRELQKIRTALPTGSYDEIAARTGLGVATVKSTLFKPERFNPAVIETALALINEQREKVESIKNLIKEI